MLLYINVPHIHNGTSHTLIKSENCGVLRKTVHVVQVIYILLYENPVAVDIVHTSSNGSSVRLDCSIVKSNTALTIDEYILTMSVMGGGAFLVH